MQSNTLKTEFIQGTIVWAFYPLTDKIDKLKRRPVLIVNNSESNSLDNDYIILPITKAIRAEPFSLLIEPTDVEGDLPVSSELRCNKPFTVRSSLITEPIGLLSQNRLADVIQLMFEALEIADD
ncbi:type II toxin-antitoxin system PemK/MazF family toxin [Spirosoma validum]|uniref:Type II toxin-antitoxin system PemK/MazF family toxin n=1 Tax=Spirosoma validum TaxID=2771355 RepID=A0A927GBF2_9BACT|nr:type II toxin-antitoxin system PemK/MazF family toxin [Spirosoma validum]MBD2751331.1 type II toxin-antitoxin system PemK/MazF family toxin [Spirosoma validum]